MDEFNCGTPEEIYGFLDMEYGQAPIFEGLNQNGQLTQIHVGRETETWSIVLTDPTVERARQTCIIDQGYFWTFGDLREYPDQDPQRAQDAIDWFHGSSTIDGKYLPSLHESFNEVAVWHGVNYDRYNYVLALDNVGDYSVYADQGLLNAHPHSGMSVALTEFGETLELNANQGTGVRAMMP
jgi:hypothetical protein